MDKTNFKTDHLVGTAAENSRLIFSIRLLPMLHLASDSFIDFQFQIINVFDDLALIDELAKPVGVLAVRIMKMIFDIVGVISLMLLGVRIGIEADNSQRVGVQSPNRHILLFLRALIGFIISRTSCVTAMKPLWNSLRLKSF